MDLRDDRGAFADRRRYALGRTSTHVADREYARQRRLERQRLAFTRSMLFAIIIQREICAGAHEAFVVETDAAINQPCRVRIGADEQEQMPRRFFFLGARLAIAPAHALDAVV